MILFGLLGAHIFKAKIRNYFGEPFTKGFDLQELQTLLQPVLFRDLRETMQNAYSELGLLNLDSQFFRKINQTFFNTKF